MNQIFLNYKKFFFSFFSILSIIGYGYFAFAAAPSGGYNPGQILDPECAPGDVDCVVKLQTSGGGSPAGSDTQIQYNNAGAFGADALATRDAVTKVSQIFRPFSYASGYTFDIDTVPAAIVPSNEPFIDGESLTFYEYAASSIAFSGTGIDDLSNSTSNFYGTYPTTYTVTVASSGTPDTFDWTDGTNSGTGVSMSTSSIPLSNGVEISFGSDKFHIPGDSWSWTYSSNSVGTATLIHQEVGSPFIFQFYSSVTGTPDIANYVVGATSGATVDVANYFGNQTFTASENVFSISTNYVISPIATITSVPGADNYIISGASGFDQYSILANEDDGKYGGIISSTSTPIVSNAQAGFITNDNILGLGVDGSGILFDNTDNSDYGFTGIFNQNGISGGIRLNQEGTTTTLDLSKTGLLFNLNNGLVTSNFAIDTQNISLYVTDPSYGNMTGIVIDSNAEAIEIGNIGIGSKITVDNGDKIISINTSSSPSDPSIQINAQTGKIRFNQAYTFPLTTGSIGQVLSLDGSGNLEWTTPSVSTSPITIANTSTLYSSGLSNTGTGDITFGNNIFFGTQAGYGATGASYSNFLGLNAGHSATNASYSNFLGYNAGNGATDAYYSNFLGLSAGYGATSAYNSNFLGYYAGNGATGASNSNFLGYNAGNGATNAYYSNFLGYYAGNGATGAYESNFLGRGAGANATDAYNSNFLGLNTGANATDAYNSNFFGDGAGYYATNASNSIFIGKSAGNNDLVNNTGSPDDFSILIGPNTSTGNNGSGVGYSNSIALGGSAINTASNQFMIGSATRPINEIVMVASGGTTCATDINGTACSSDERLKTNITDLTTGILDKVVNTKTVTFNWNNNTDTTSHIGFIAQDIQQYFPELVSTGSTGYLSVNYAGMTPVLVQAIREINLKITTINDMTTPNTWRDSLIAWFGNVENGIIKFFAGEIETKKLCIADDAGDKTCITKAQLDQLLMNTVNNSVIVTSPSPEPAPQDPPSDDSVDPSTDTPVPASDTEDTTVSTPDTSSDPVPSDTESVPDTGESSTATE